MIAIGLTGGIGAGKSTVSEYLINKGYDIIDADKMAHEITQPGTQTLDDIVKCFGKEILFDDGSLDRKKLAGIVFGNEKKKNDLQSLTTDVIVHKILTKLNHLRDTDYCGIIFVDAPLLFESGTDKLMDAVWLVTADIEIRINRVMERDKTTRENVLKRISAQMDESIKKLKSQEIIDNSLGKEELYKKIEELLLKYDN